jgi:hypothetical protein
MRIFLLLFFISSTALGCAQKNSTIEQISIKKHNPYDKKAESAMDFLQKETKKLFVFYGIENAIGGTVGEEAKLKSMKSWLKTYFNDYSESSQKDISDIDISNLSNDYLKKISNQEVYECLLNYIGKAYKKFKTAKFLDENGKLIQNLNIDNIDAIKNCTLPGGMDNITNARSIDRVSEFYTKWKRLHN